MSNDTGQFNIGGKGPIMQPDSAALQATGGSFPARHLAESDPTKNLGRHNMLLSLLAQEEAKEKEKIYIWVRDYPPPQYVT